VIGLDAGVLLRLFDRSDQALTARVEGIVSVAPPEGGCFVDPLVLADFAARLEADFKLPRHAVADYLERILRAPELSVGDADEALEALNRFRATGATFGDCLLAAINQSHGCDITVTFDRRTAKCAGFTLLKG
jgi:predicted nucleic-acid-binding protein